MKYGELNLDQIEVMTIKLGTGLKTADYFRKALKDSGNHIDIGGDDILGKFTVSNTEIEVDLVNLSVAKLGFKEGTTRSDIYNRALELDFKLCPPEVGPQLRLQYADQPEGEWLRIAMEPIKGSGGSLRVFGVGRDGDERWLRGFSYPIIFCRGIDRWVFLSGK